MGLTPRGGRASACRTVLICYSFGKSNTESERSVKSFSVLFVTERSIKLFANCLPGDSNEPRGSDAVWDDLSVRVVTWNLWWRFGPWEERQPAIGAELERLDPDIALLQEVWAADGRDQATELGERLDRHVARTTVDDGDQPQEFGNAILSRWPIEWTRQQRLPNERGEPSHRSVLVALVTTPAGPQLFAVTHLDWRYAASPLRTAQLGSVVEWLAELDGIDPAAHQRPGSPPPAGLPVVLGGDFNAVPDSDEIRRLTGLAEPYLPGRIFTDAWAAVGDGPGFTWTRDNPHASEALWPRRRLDYVFVGYPRAKPHSNPKQAWLAGVDPVDGIVPSDHYAVAVELDHRQTL